MSGTFSVYICWPGKDGEATWFVVWIHNALFDFCNKGCQSIVCLVQLDIRGGFWVFVFLYLFWSECLQPVWALAEPELAVKFLLKCLNWNSSTLSRLINRLALNLICRSIFGAGIRSMQVDPFKCHHPPPSPPVLPSPALHCAFPDGTMVVFHVRSLEFLLYFDLRTFFFKEK